MSKLRMKIRSKLKNLYKNLSKWKRGNDDKGNSNRKKHELNK